MNEKTILAPVSVISVISTVVSFVVYMSFQDSIVHGFLAGAATAFVLSQLYNLVASRLRRSKISLRSIAELSFLSWF